MTRAKSVLVAALYLVFVFALYIATVRRLRDWRSDLTLWSSAVRSTPDKPRPLINYAHELSKRGDIDAAEPLFLRAIEMSKSRLGTHGQLSVEARINWALADYHLGEIAARRGDSVTARRYFTEMNILWNGLPK